ncbi:MAG: hypothetical protein AAF358_16515 [Pseudomonadota bacterium]
MAKTATEKLNQKKQPKKVVLEKDFAGIKAGQRMLVGTPKMVDDYIRKVPAGETRTMPRLRRDLARRNRCDATCPVSTAIFVRIAAEAALEALEGGASASDVTPFWRVVGPEDKIAKKLPVDSEWISHQRASESLQP